MTVRQEAIQRLQLAQAAIDDALQRLGPARLSLPRMATSAQLSALEAAASVRVALDRLEASPDFDPS